MKISIAFWIKMFYNINIYNKMPYCFVLVSRLRDFTRRNKYKQALKLYFTEEK